MTEDIQMMPDLESMTKKDYTPHEWFQYHKNVWTSYLAAGCIDLINFTAMKTADPEWPVADGHGINKPVKQRLEDSKEYVEKCVRILAAVEKLLAMSPEDFAKNCLSEEALAVAEDMMPAPEPKEGDVCDLDDGSGKGVLGLLDGKLVCAVKEAAPADEAKPAVDASADASAEKPEGSEDAKADEPDEAAKV